MFGAYNETKPLKWEKPLQSMNDIKWNLLPLLRATWIYCKLSNLSIVQAKQSAVQAHLSAI